MNYSATFSSADMCFHKQEAIEADSFLTSDPLTLRNGDVMEGFKASDVVIEGEAYMGGQEHFYHETQTSIAVPSGEDNEMTLMVSAQFLHYIQVRSQV